MKKIILSAAAILCTTAICLGFYIMQCALNASAPLLQKEEARAECEVKNRKGKVIFKCEGNENQCETTYLGNTLTCSGKEVAVEANGEIGDDEVW